ncbi:MAG: GNAT family N-acetyltransferase [Pseudomonadota bacterium]
MRVAILHNAVHDRSSADEKDVLAQVAAISAALMTLGHELAVLPCDLNLSALKRQLTDIGPDSVFNLVESLDARGALIHLVPFLLEGFPIPYTGAQAEATLLTSNKIMAKTRMRAAGLPTAEWIGPYPAKPTPLQKIGAPQSRKNKTWIIKSVWEHASIGLDEEWLVKNGPADTVLTEMARRATDLGGACFAEEFIDGREFNLSLLTGPDGPVVLPPAEIRFVGYGPEKPRIVGYRAKWDSDSYEYTHTPRHFDFPEEDRPLLRNLKKLALSAWRCFGLEGYARVDFRVDSNNTPWILEVNTNPCLSPDAGFPAALEEAGIPFTEAVARILAAAAFSKDRLGFENRVGLPLAIDSPPVNGISESSSSPRLRNTVMPEDTQRVGQLVKITGFFNADEVDVAMELVDTYLNIGEASGYRFIFAESNGQLAGYACYGPIACTASSYDLYWIAVHPDVQGKGLGKKLLAATEQKAREAGGARMYAETSQRPQYDSTRSFYEHGGYRVASVLEDFYAPGDARVTYCKVL